MEDLKRGMEGGEEEEEEEEEEEDVSQDLKIWKIWRKMSSLVLQVQRLVSSNECRSVQL